MFVRSGPELDLFESDLSKVKPRKVRMNEITKSSKIITGKRHPSEEPDDFKKVRVDHETPTSENKSVFNPSAVQNAPNKKRRIHRTKDQGPSDISTLIKKERHDGFNFPLLTMQAPQLEAKILTTILICLVNQF